MTRPIFDAHLDLAMLEVLGRDMTRRLEDLDEHSAGAVTPPSVTLPALAKANVRACLATVFTESDGADDVGYPADDREAAHLAGVRQLDVYDAWADAGLISPLGAPPEPGRPPLLEVGILVECADPIRDADELRDWAARGVVAVGLAWARGSRHAGGNSTPERALRDEGRELVDAIDELGLVHDLSHLSRKAADELLSRSRGRVMASHSNAKRLSPDFGERNLDDDQVAEIARRGGVVGINLFTGFCSPSRDQQARIDDVVHHADALAEAAGSRAHVGLGTDLDGGFGADKLPESIASHADLTRLFAALAGAGWSEAEIDAFAFGNWARFWGLDQSAGG